MQATRKGSDQTAHMLDILENLQLLGVDSADYILVYQVCELLISISRSQRSPLLRIASTCNIHLRIPLRVTQAHLYQ